MDNKMLGMVVGLKDTADNESVMTTAINMMRGDLWKMKPEFFSLLDAHAGLCSLIRFEEMARFIPRLSQTLLVLENNRNTRKFE